MSKPTSSRARSIPTGVLVKVSSRTHKLEKPPSLAAEPIPMATLAPPEAAPVCETETASVPARRSLGGWVVAGSVCVWMLVMVAIGVCAVRQDRPQSAQPDLLAEAAPPTGSADVSGQLPGVRKLAGEIAPLTAVKPAGDNITTAKANPEEVAPNESDLAWIFAKGVPDQRNRVAAKDANGYKLKLDVNLFANCSQIGSDVLFVKQPRRAFQLARAQEKLVFWVHLSGNLEEKEFT